MVLEDRKNEVLEHIKKAKMTIFRELVRKSDVTYDEALQLAKKHLTGSEHFCFLLGALVALKK